MPTIPLQECSPEEWCGNVFREMQSEIRSIGAYTVTHCRLSPDQFLILVVDGHDPVHRGLIKRLREDVGDDDEEESVPLGSDHPIYLGIVRMDFVEDLKLVAPEIVRVFPREILLNEYRVLVFAAGKISYRRAAIAPEGEGPPKTGKSPIGQC